MMIEVSDTKLLGIAQSCYRMDDPEEGLPHERPWIVVMPNGSEYGLTESEFLIYRDALVVQDELMEILGKK
jgi:hypothetical protein